MARRLLLSVIGVALLAPAPARAAAVPVLVIDGKGHGHGVGMAQDGAYWMGRQGRSTAQILAQFYPGTTPGRAGGEVRVTVLAGARPGAVVGFPDGGEVRDGRDGAQSPGFPVRVPPGGSARLRHAGRQYGVEVAGASAAPAPGPAGPGARGASAAAAPAPTTAPPATTAPTGEPTTTTTSPRLLRLPGDEPLLPLPSLPAEPVPSVPSVPLPTAAPTTAPPATAPGRAASARGLWAVPAGGGTLAVAARGHRYRGVLQAVAGDGLRLVNHVDVEQYLRGMGEVRDPRWPPAALRAQAIAARTYALRAVGGGGELCDTQQCQVYLGAQAEYAAMDKAVSATRGQVLMFRRGLASTVYSANGGGFSASPEEGFGTPGAGYPYLRPAPYPTGDPGPWSVTVALRDVAARIGYRGRIHAVATRAAGPSGRVLQVTVEGTGGVRTVSGIDFDRALGLRSTMFAVRTAEAAVPPAPPPPADAGSVQGLPGGAAAAAPAAPLRQAAVATAGRAGGRAPGPAAPSAAARALLAGVAWLLLAVVAAASLWSRMGTLGGPGPRPARAGRRRRRRAGAGRPRRRVARRGRPGGSGD
ncbi:MAG: SpoIID/LytB domain-containing protein [Acidimicrobiia bacterium]